MVGGENFAAVERERVRRLVEVVEVVEVVAMGLVAVGQRVREQDLSLLG